MNIPDHICENSISISWVKILKLLNADPDPGSCQPVIREGKNRIRDPGWKKSDTGWKKIGFGILDKHPGSATPLCGYVCKN